MNPAQRAKRLRAHSLRCQGLTYRQIGERMGCAHSTAAQYVREFESHRDEIIESLAADLLVHSVAALQDPDPDLHARHINAARELRLLVNSLDQVADRRQKRDRRIVMEQEADSIKYIEALDQLTTTMREAGVYDLTPYLTDPEASRTEHFQPPLPQTSPSGGGAQALPQTSPSGEGAQALPQTSPPGGGAQALPQTSPSGGGAQALPQTSPSGGGAPKGRRGPTATTAKAAPSPTTPVQSQPKPDHQPTKSAQNRPTSNKSERKTPKRPPVQAPPRPKRKKAHSQILTPDPLPPPSNRRELSPDDPLVRGLFRNW